MRYKATIWCIIDVFLCNFTKSTGTVTLARRTTFQRHNPVSRSRGRKWSFQFGNIRKINPKKTPNFFENGWLYRHGILHDNLEDQVQWHTSIKNSIYSINTFKWNPSAICLTLIGHFTWEFPKIRHFQFISAKSPMVGANRKHWAWH